MTIAPTAADQRLEITRPRHLRVTPAGAFRAVSSPRPDATAYLLQSLLRAPLSPLLDEDLARSWAEGDLQGGLAILAEAQENGLVEGRDYPIALPTGPLEQVVPPLLAELADHGEVLVSDPDGLALWSNGLTTDVVARLAALSADLGSLHARHQEAIEESVGLAGGAWALVDGIGASHLGCWPLHISERRFVLVALGLPRIHHPRFTDLIGLLVHHYG